MYILAQYIPGDVLSRWLWNCIKLELFEIGGACQHSGNCCRKIELVNKGTVIQSAAAFKTAIDEDASLSRFVPDFDEEKRIQSFSCSCLNDDNYCVDYENRPLLCRQYPASFFISHDRILAGCGYKVLQKYPSSWIFVKNVKRRVDVLRRENGIT